MLHHLERAAAAAATARDAALRSDVGRRRAGGIVHTPAWVARYVVGEVARALAAAGGPEALDGAVVIDPAVGTGVFPAAVLALGCRPAVIVGVDVDGAAVESSRAVLETAAAESGVRLELRVGDALAMDGETLLGGEAGARRALVVVGNPPWAARSGSRGVAGSDALVEALRPAGERRSGVLSDAYVRFLAWACALARGHDAACAVGLVTNGSFVDGPVHALLRERLAATFDDVAIVDLGGGSLVARAPGARDENVFAVRPPVAITVAARGARRDGARFGEVRYAKVRGTVAAKEAALARPLAWQSVGDPRRSFAARTAHTARWQGWTSVAALFPFHREGVQSNRDALVVDVDRDALLERLRAFAGGAHDALAPARAHFDPTAARRALRAAIDDGTLDRYVAPLAYRPLDTRYACLHPAVCHRPRPELREAMAHGGLALVTARKDRGDVPWAHFGVVAHVVDNCWLSTRSSCRARAFPAHGPDGAPNVDARRWEDAIGAELTFDAVLGWTLAILAAPAYRARHREELHGDYARIPGPRGVEEMREVTAVGTALAELFVRGGRVGAEEAAVDVASPSGEEPSTLRVGHIDVVRSYRRARGSGVEARAAAIARAIAALDARVAPLLAD